MSVCMCGFYTYIHAIYLYTDVLMCIRENVCEYMCLHVFVLHVRDSIANQSDNSM